MRCRDCPNNDTCLFQSEWGCTPKFKITFTNSQNEATEEREAKE